MKIDMMTEKNLSSNAQVDSFNTGHVRELMNALKALSHVIYIKLRDAHADPCPNS